MINGMIDGIPIAMLNYQRVYIYILLDIGTIVNIGILETIVTDG